MGRFLSKTAPDHKVLSNYWYHHRLPLLGRHSTSNHQDATTCTQTSFPPPHHVASVALFFLHPDAVLLQSDVSCDMDASILTCS
ncbi:hypothetical protein IF1G_09008 [Cordyceps javanica]|uniref:Uncharacterized protein n=1 Tax=Cordyceps javanica TaxID=43265 RepID=A0A545USR1_9HYPO|nr:hypothetical protein IF1G_09008 [Cordyceps javanica]